MKKGGVPTDQPPLQKTAKELGEAWLAENKEAIEAYNRRVAENGIAIPPLWAESESEL